jgi:phage terminase large subunit GpA-like protein
MSELIAAQFRGILEAANVQISTIKPSDWVEQNIVMGKPRPGAFRYSHTPYTREIIDCLSPEHPARIVSVMKGAQLGFSAGVFIPGLGWMIKNNPGNCYFMVGAPDLVEKAVEKIDLMIDGAGLRSYIKPQVMRNRANKSGDTNTKKDFSGGYISIGSANNHKAIAQVDLQYILLDDLDAMKGVSDSSGNFLDLIQQRAASYKDIYKMFLVSTPLQKQSSLIEPAYLSGDKRKYMVECQCCHEPIVIKWNVKQGETVALSEAKFDGGMTYNVNSFNQVEPKSVMYRCYLCGNSFTDKNKYNMLNGGYWLPTAQPQKEGSFSYHISSLYAPIGMFDWAHYASKYHEANPVGGNRIEAKFKTLVNTCFGETYEAESKAISANELQMNVRPYEIGTVPEKLSIQDGNGEIMLITCAADMNGNEDDARLDYEVVAWAENGSSYSITHGSIGTFIPRENKDNKIDRQKFTYRQGLPNSVWIEFEKVLTDSYFTDTGRRMQVFQTGLDTGYMDKYAWGYIDSTNCKIYGLKGLGQHATMKMGYDKKTFKQGLERGDLFSVEGNVIKDDIADLIKLKWDRNSPQPAGFMNFPTPSNGKYLYSNFFSHYEAEHKIEKLKDGVVIGFNWEKKDSIVQNHLFDCCQYNRAIKDILTWQYCKAMKIQNGTWSDFVAILKGD